MNLADKPCYPYRQTSQGEGLTFRERLIIALSSNPKVFNPEIPMEEIERLYKEVDGSADKMWCAMKLRNGHIKFMFEQADAIIEELEKS